MQDTNTLVGVVSGYEVLSNSIAEYDVARDIIVPRGASLTIEAGVTLKFHAKRSLHVFGKLRITGSEAGPVTLTAQEHTDAQNPEPLVRLVENNPQRGIVQVRSKVNQSEWVTLCASELPLTASTHLCREAGFGPVEGVSSVYRYSTQSEKVVTDFSCRGPNFEECQQKEAMQRCPSNRYLYLYCYERRRWGGVKLHLVAQRSEITQTTFDRYGHSESVGNTALNIEFFDHNISFLSFHNPHDEAQEIYIARSNSFTFPRLTGLYVDKRNNTLNTEHSISAQDSRFAVVDSGVPLGKFSRHSNLHAR